MYRDIEGEISNLAGTTHFYSGIPRSQKGRPLDSWLRSFHNLLLSDEVEEGWLSQPEVSDNNQDQDAPLTIANKDAGKQKREALNRHILD